MAKIALIVAETSELSTTRTAKILTDLGHSVSIIRENDLTISQGLTYDLLITCRISDSNGLPNKIKELSDRGIPAILGFFNYNLGNNAQGSSILRSLGLSSEVSMTTSNTCRLTEEGSRILYPLVGSFNPYLSPTYMSVIQTSSLSPLAQILSTTSVVEETSLVYFPKGTVNKLGSTLNSDLIFAGFIYGNNSEYNYITITSVMSSLVSYLLDKRYQLKGRVLNSLSMPLQRTLHVHDQVTGRLLNTNTSNEEGFYNIPLRDPSLVYIICITNDINKRNQIIGPLYPTLSEE